MKKLTIGEIVKATHGNKISGDNDKYVESICIDSRKVKNEDLFFALIGESKDGHIFLNEVIDKGCRCIIASDLQSVNQKKIREKEIGLILVDDTTKALQELAKYHISSKRFLKVAVTGSTGKTTTKEMLYSIFKEKYKVFRTPGNYNNHIGLPLSLLSMEDDVEVGIFEMGMSQFGEIDLLAELVRPDIGIITNIGTSHIENLGSQEGILRAKMELTNYFEKDSTLIVNVDNEMLNSVKTKGDYQLIKTGTTGKSDFIISNIEDFGEAGIKFSIEHKEQLETYHLNIPGRHNAFNGTLAIAAAVQSGMTLKEAKVGFQKTELVEKRLSIKGKNGIKIIDDTYNASPESMKAALDVLLATGGVRKIAILGDMLELGPGSAEYHLSIGEYIAQRPIDILICVGKESANIATGAKGKMGERNIIWEQNKETVYEKIISLISMGDVILVKGSRGMEMDKIVKKIMEKE